MHPFDISYQNQYKDGDRVEFYIDGPNGKLYQGTIRGKANQCLINFWIVELDEKIPSWDFKCIVVIHTLMRPEGSNEKFPYQEI